MRLRQVLEGLLAVTAVLLFLLVYLSVTNPNSSDCYASFNNAELMHHPFFVPMLKSLLAEVGKLPTASKMLLPTSSSSSTISHHVSVTDCGIPSFARLGRSYDAATLMNTFRTLIRIENERCVQCNSTLRKEVTEWISCLLKSRTLGLNILTKTITQALPRDKPLPEALPQPSDTNLATLNNDNQQPAASAVPIIFVVSNRRSGTHMSMDMLHNSFNGPMMIIKTNHVKATTRLGCECIRWMQRMGGIMHPYRNVKDVLVSTFYYRQGKHGESDPWLKKDKRTFSEFLRRSGGEVIEEWRQTNYGWQQQPGVVWVYFTDNVDDARREAYVLPRLAQAFNLTLKGTPETRMRQFWKLRSKVVMPMAGKGEQGWRNMFSREDLLFVEAELAKPFNASYLLVGDRACPPVSCDHPQPVTNYTWAKSHPVLKNLYPPPPPGCAAMTYNKLTVVDVRTKKKEEEEN